MKQYAMGTVTAVLWCAAALLVLRFGLNKPHNQIEITVRTGPLATNERSRVPYHVIEVGRLACLQLVGHCLLYLTLWARPERADEVTGITGTRRLIIDVE